MSDDGPPAPEPDAPRPSIEACRLHVVLFEPEIAGNTGAVGRTCVAAGASLWLVRPLGFHVDARQIRRAGLDYWPHLPFRVVDTIDAVIDHFGPDRLWWFTTRATPTHTEVAYREGDALIFGPESRGLPTRLIDDAARLGRAVRIPIRPEARSLNLANAASIATFEALRQIGDP